jgi:DNA-binding PadR family transcriptional regulator
MSAAFSRPDRGGAVTGRADKRAVLEALDDQVERTARFLVATRLGWASDPRSITPILRALEREGLVERLVVGVRRRRIAWRRTPAGTRELERLRGSGA